jgi:ribonuclease T1
VLFSGRSLRWQALHKTGLVLIAAGAVSLGNAEARSHRRHADASPEGSTGVQLSLLPPQAQATYRLILAGGPFASKRDGIVFSNRERALPAEPRGFYHEYTVPTPGAQDRGARRIVCGGRPVTQPQACYYTADHYASFRRIAS